MEQCGWPEATLPGDGEEGLLADQHADGPACSCDAAFGGGTIRGEPDTIVTLVHGTFAQHASWIRGDSKLSLALRGIRSTAVLPFCWTGANTHADRLAEAEKLRRHLTCLRRRQRHARLFVVAHSHGGNVAMYAMKHPRVRSCVTASGGGIVTLATPFIHVRRRPDDMTVGRVLWASLAVFAFALFVFVVSIVSSEYDWEFWVAFAVLVIGGGAGLFLLDSALRYRKSLVPARTFLPMVGDKDVRDQELTALQLPELDPAELLVIRPTADEASGLLVAAQFWSWLTTRYLRGLAWLERTLRATAMAIVVGLILGSLGVGLVSQAAEGTVEDVTMILFVAVISLAIFGVGAAALPALVLTAVAAASFARDGLFWPLIAQMTAEAGIVGEGRGLQVDVSMKSGLNHSNIYDDPEVIEAIVAHVSPQVPSAWRGFPRFAL